jgi:hypothetical protein
MPLDNSMDRTMTVEILLLSLAIVASGYYIVVRKRRNQWPVIDAMIQKGAIGEIDLAEAGKKPAVFLGYSFKVNELRYAHYFILLGNEERVHDLHRRLPGTTLQVSYDPSNPSTSFLVNYSDARFEGLIASQSPTLLTQAPAFDLQDSLGI